MAYQIIWTSEAEKDFSAIISYLKENWSVFSAEKFSEKILKKLERIATMPYQPRFTSKPNIQIIKLDKKNVLFFTIENDHMILLSIYPYLKDLKMSKYY
jgi:plasmid stabilization system protein ParE